MNDYFPAYQRMQSEDKILHKKAFPRYRKPFWNVIENAIADAMAYLIKSLSLPKATHMALWKPTRAL
ncbi:MAG: hypothetical protein ACFN27_03215 [Prevotella sp.]